MSIDDRSLDYSIAEYLLEWDKINVENVTSFEGNGWELPSGNLLSIEDTPRFSSNMRDALTIYNKYKKLIDDYWEENHFTVNARNICKTALCVNGIQL